MNYDLLFAILFYGFVILFFLKNKKRFEIQNKIFFLYKTKLGLKFMDKISKTFPKILRVLSYFSIFLGIFGMIFIFYTLIKGSITLILTPTGTPSIAPVFPGVSVPGAPTLSFWHWIIAILIVAIVHEFSHGIFARLNKITIKSSGFAFLGPILAAFVEPDEKQLKKINKKDQLAIFSAGPFSNLLFGVLFLFLLIGITPLENKIIDKNGIIVNELIKGYPADKLGMETPFILLAIDEKPTLNEKQFSEVVKLLKPGKEIKLSTDQGEFTLTTVKNPEDKEKGFIGITNLKQHRKVKEGFFLGNKILPIVDWINLLLIWLFIINIGVGLFNLLPLGPVDGGRIFYTLTLFFIKDKQKAKKIWGYVSFICLVLIFINLLPWFVKFLLFLLKPILLLISLLI
jgi:membrane-associated protease RseP (regulator of RpoE activity)